MIAQLSTRFARRYAGRRPPLPPGGRIATGAPRTAERAGTAFAHLTELASAHPGSGAALLTQQSRSAQEVTP